MTSAERDLLACSQMPAQRLRLVLLGLSLLAPACGPGGEGGSDGPGSTSEASSSGTTGQTESTHSPTESTHSPTEAGSSTEPADTTGTTTLDTVGPDETTTAGEAMPGPCDEVPVPEPANKFVKYAALKHVVDEGRHYLHFFASDKSDNSIEDFLELGEEEPALGEYAVSFSAEVWIGEAGSSVGGAATVELVALTEECVAGVIRDVVPDEEDPYSPKELAVELLSGGFVGKRLTL